MTLPMTYTESLTAAASFTAPVINRLCITTPPHAENLTLVALHNQVVEDLGVQVGSVEMWKCDTQPRCI